jgi:hypothetical protein
LYKKDVIKVGRKKQMDVKEIIGIFLVIIWLMIAAYKVLEIIASLREPHYRYCEKYRSDKNRKKSNPRQYTTIELMYNVIGAGILAFSLYLAGCRQYIIAAAVITAIYLVGLYFLRDRFGKKYFKK